jgi:hypothetical protein
VEGPRLEKRLRGRRAYYTIYWSKLKRAEKYSISREVPSMAGLYELFFRDADGSLKMFHYAIVWLGGLRSAIRYATDPSLVLGDDALRHVVASRECWYRYLVCPIRPDMEDLIHFFSRSDGLGKPAASSGRYDDILLKEFECQ